MVVFGAAATASHQISSMATRLLHDLDRLEKEKANTEQQTATILRGPWKKQEEDATNKDTPSDGDSPA